MCLHAAVARGFGPLPAHSAAVLPFLAPLPGMIRHFFTALGAAFFSPRPGVGAIVFLALIGRSRYLAFLGVAGYLGGLSALSVLGLHLNPVVAHWAAFNWILAALAVGGIYTVPGRKSFCFALFASALAAIVTAVTQSWLGAYGLPVMAVPFLFSTALVLTALRKRVVLGDPVLTLERPDLPEVNRERLRIARFRGVAYDRPLLRPPFLGTWAVYQGFHGEHTHQAPWQYALDFFRIEGGQSFRGDGAALEDYRCYGRPVMSPVWGEVAALSNDCPDNAPGEMDTARNWGNHVLIRVHPGCYVLLAHLQPDSLAVRIGQRLKPGDPVARCGNSGRSTQPHLHLHVQSGPDLGAPTLPFALCGVDVIQGEATARFHLHLEPAAGVVLRTPQPCDFRSLLGLFAGREFGFRVETANGRQRDRRLTVQVDLLGQFRLHSDRGASIAFVDSGVALAFFDRRGPRDPFLDATALCLGLSPNQAEATTWEDRPGIGQMPLTAPERILAAFRYPLGTGVSSHYRRLPYAITGRWVQTGRHQCALVPGKPLSVETQATICAKAGLREFSISRQGICLLHASLLRIGGNADSGVPAWHRSVAPSTAISNPTDPIPEPAIFHGTPNGDRHEF